MRIPKCIDDLRETLVYFIIFLLSEITLYHFLDGVLAMLALFLLFVAVFIGVATEYLYFGRNITIDSDGCTFSLGKYTKTYKWSQMSVIYCENNSFQFGDCESPAPGIILSGTPIRKPQKIAAMTYCRFKHPLTTVFLRFQNDTDVPLTGKRIYRGYLVDKERIMCLLKEVGKLNI